MRRCNARTNYNGQRHGTLTRNLPWRINVINVTRGPLLVNNRLITPDRCLICAVFEHARNRSPSSASMDFQFAACINRPIRCYFFRFIYFYFYSIHIVYHISLSLFKSRCSLFSFLGNLKYLQYRSKIFPSVKRMRHKMDSSAFYYSFLSST